MLYQLGPRPRLVSSMLFIMVTRYDGLRPKNLNLRWRVSIFQIQMVPRKPGEGVEAKLNPHPRDLNDYFFDGGIDDDSYYEDDPPNPMGVYGKS